MNLHLIKLAVGAKTVADVAVWQAARAKTDAPLRHRTRNFPKRADELLDGGSIYWVVNRVLCIRQRIEDIVAATREDGAACADLVLHPKLVPVRGRLVKPFQGWRYLVAVDAPSDEVAGAGGFAELPEAMKRELAALALL